MEINNKKQQQPGTAFSKYPGDGNGYPWYLVTVLFIPGERIQAAGLFMQGGTFSDVMCGTILAAVYDGRSRG